MKYLKSLFLISAIFYFSTPVMAAPEVKSFSQNSITTNVDGKKYEAGNFGGISYFISHSEKRGLFAGKKAMLTDRVVNYELPEDAKTNLSNHWRVGCDENEHFKYCQITKRDLIVAVAEKLPPLVRINSIPKFPTTIGMAIDNHKVVTQQSEDGFFTIEKSDELIKQLTGSADVTIYYNDLVKHDDILDSFESFGFNAAFKFAIWMLAAK